MTARLLTVTAAEYHADPCARPSLSASIAKTLIARSPAHAHFEHPRLGGQPRKPSSEMDLGAIVHALLLGAGEFTVIDADSYRTNAAKEARDEARSLGRVPVLAPDLAPARVAAREIALKLAARGIALDGASELAVEWEEPSAHGPVLCRAMIDHAWLDDGRGLDLKTARSAAIRACESTAYDLGYDIQCAAYTSALTQLRPHLAGRIEFLFAFAETDAPHAVSVFRPAGDFRELGERRWRRAVETWAECLKTGTWPEYQTSDEVGWLSVPGWALAREEATT